jgi:hypothetical protein
MEFAIAPVMYFASNRYREIVWRFLNSFPFAVGEDIAAINPLKFNGYDM